MTEYSDIPNAKEFFKAIDILPNMPAMNSLLGSVRLGYQDEALFMQGLGHRNLILMTVLLNSYVNRKNISFRLVTVEEPEAHLCVSNVLLMASFINVFSTTNSFTQLMYSTHSVEFINKLGLDKVVVLHNGVALSLKDELDKDERAYLASNPNTDIFKILFSHRVILVEGITEELLIKSYLQMRRDLNEIKVISFHKGYKNIITIWKKVNLYSKNRLGIVRDYDDQPNAQKEHEALQDKQVIVRTTTTYTLENEIVDVDYELLKRKYGDEYGWSSLSKEQMQDVWKKSKADIMLRISQDLINGNLTGFILPSHIQEIIDFMHEKDE